MLTTTRRAAPLALLLSCIPLSAAHAQAIDFGDDASEFSRDGECDDRRFTGPGMTDTLLLESDVKHDATDCRVAFEQKRIQYVGDRPNAKYDTPGADEADEAETETDNMMWGDNASPRARNGVCDDMRYTGAGMARTTLRGEDVKHDAADCQAAFRQGRIRLRN